MPVVDVAVLLYVEAWESLGKTIQCLEAKGILAAAGHKHSTKAYYLVGERLRGATTMSMLAIIRAALVASFK